MNSSELFRLDGKTALITGSARGLGREIAVGLAQSGCSLVLADLADPEETAKKVAAAGARSICVRGDVSAEEDVEKIVRQTISEFKKVDILVNNAGISQLSYTATEELPLAEWEKITAVNLTGTFLCCKHAGKEMIRGGGGSIVNIASTAGITGVVRAPAYCASKAGTILLTKSLALEWARHQIRVNAVAPHYLETELTKGLRNSEKVYSALVKQIPMRRFAKPSEIVGAVLFLASPASSFTTGTVTVADGGYLSQ
jgi:NAD(P)-dependent dehydrogenase (short-subunit alcohol dehydrogenase family)